MLLVGPVRGAQVEGEGLGRLASIESAIPAVTHVDGSARVQTVTAERNGLFYDLLKAFEAATTTDDAPGCPVLVNTSFNVRGEPIVHSPGRRHPGVPAHAHGRARHRTHSSSPKRCCPPTSAQPFTADQIADAYGLD